MTGIDYLRQAVHLDALPEPQRRYELGRFRHCTRVFHYVTEAERVAPHGGGLSVKLVLAGEETFLVPGGVLRLRAGETLVMPPGILHGSEIRGRTETFSVFFPQALCRRLAGAAAATDPLDSPDELAEPAAPSVPMLAEAAVRRQLDSARRALQTQDWTRAEEHLQEATQSLVVTAAELQAAGQRLTLARAAQRQELLRRLQRARACLHDHAAEAVALDVLAEASQLSRFHLLRSFRAAFGRTPAQYHAELRLERAAALLRQRSTATVAEVAHAVGYGSHSAFSRAWKRRHGTPPRAGRP